MGVCGSKNTTLTNQPSQVRRDPIKWAVPRATGSCGSAPQQVQDCQPFRKTQHHHGNYRCGDGCSPISDEICEPNISSGPSFAVHSGRDKLEKATLTSICTTCGTRGSCKQLKPDAISQLPAQHLDPHDQVYFLQTNSAGIVTKVPLLAISISESSLMRNRRTRDVDVPNDEWERYSLPESLCTQLSPFGGFQKKTISPS